MPLGSDRTRRGFYQTYLAERSDPGSEFGAPELLSELAHPAWSTVIDGFLSDDGLILLFSGSTAERPVSYDLYVAWRKSTDEPFEVHSFPTRRSSDLDRKSVV